MGSAAARSANSPSWSEGICRHLVAPPHLGAVEAVDVLASRGGEAGVDAAVRASPPGWRRTRPSAASGVYLFSVVLSPDPPAGCHIVSGGVERGVPRCAGGAQLGEGIDGARGAASRRSTNAPTPWRAPTRSSSTRNCALDGWCSARERRSSLAGRQSTAAAPPHAKRRARRALGRVRSRRWPRCSDHGR